jgi:pyruvate, water dikinase
MEYCRLLDDLSRDDEPGFGGKSASLGELLAAGIPVPPGFALATAAFHAFMAQAGLQPTIERQLAALSVDAVESVRSACAEITDTIRSAPVPADVQEEIERGYAALGGAPVAVRSSALGEDSHTATFAGQQETFVWVQGAPGVVGAVRDCWASLYSPTAVTYRARAPQSPGAPAMGVAVQLMVDALVSGVMFTCNPVSGDPSIVAVNASWGLGEAVVSGEVTPDEYLLSKVTGEVVRRRVGAKQIEHLPAPEGGGTMQQDVPDERRDAECLTDSDLQALLDVARRVERHFGSHQDIEWALARKGTTPERLFVVQSRPVTGLPEREKPKPASALSLVMNQFGVKDG